MPYGTHENQRLHGGGLKALLGSQRGCSKYFRATKSGIILNANLRNLLARVGKRMKRFVQQWLSSLQGRATIILHS
jgi:hypothetical protein